MNIAVKKSINNKFDITFLMRTSQLQVNCDVTTSVARWIVTSWPERKQTKRGTMSMCENRFFDRHSCHVRNRIMYALSWRTVHALTRNLFWCLFMGLRSNEGNKHHRHPRAHTLNFFQLMHYPLYIPCILMVEYNRLYPMHLYGRTRHRISHKPLCCALFCDCHIITSWWFIWYF